MTMWYFLSSFINSYSHKLVAEMPFVAHCCRLCSECQKSHLKWTDRRQSMRTKEAAHFRANLCTIDGPSETNPHVIWEFFSSLLSFFSYRFILHRSLFGIWDDCSTSMLNSVSRLSFDLVRFMLRELMRERERENGLSSPPCNQS